MSETALRIQVGSKSLEIAVQRLDTAQKRSTSRPLKQWLASLSTKAKKPLRSLNNSLRSHIYNPPNPPTPTNRPRLARRRESVHFTAAELPAPPSPPPIPHLARRATTTTDLAQQYSDAIPFPQDGKFAIAFSMSGAYPTLPPSRIKSLPTLPDPPYAPLLAANQFGSVRGRSTLHHGIPRHRSRASDRSYTPAASVSQHYGGPASYATQRYNADPNYPLPFFTQHDIDHAFRDVADRPYSPASLLESDAAGSGAQLLEALIRDVDQACMEWVGGCSGMWHNQRASGAGLRIRAAASGSIGRDSAATAGNVSPRTCPARSVVNMDTRRTYSF